MRFFQSQHRPTLQCPAGTNENSPPFQRRVEVGIKSSPAGAAEFWKLFSAVPPGLGLLPAIFPPLKRRAIVNRHFVTLRRISSAHFQFNGSTI